MQDERYIALIGDIVKSKKIKDRNALQKKFKRALDSINLKYEKDIASKFMITLGDEFQGLLLKSDNLMSIIFEIEKEMNPTEFRFGIGIGEIYTDINKEMPLGADGPAYHKARRMIEKLKEKEVKYKDSPNNILIATSDIVIDDLLESILELTYSIKSKWTKRQIEIIEVYKKNKGNQYKTADELNVLQSTVNKSIKTSRLYQYDKGIASITKYLSKKEGG